MHLSLSTSFYDCSCTFYYSSATWRGPTSTTPAMAAPSCSNNDGADSRNGQATQSADTISPPTHEHDPISTNIASEGICQHKYHPSASLSVTEFTDSFAKSDQWKGRTTIGSHSVVLVRLQACIQECFAYRLPKVRLCENGPETNKSCPTRLNHGLLEEPPLV